MTEIQGYKYITDDTGTTKAIQLSTGEVTETVWMCLPIGSQIRTPDGIAAQTEYLKLKEQNELRRLSNNDLGKFFFVSSEEDFKDLLPQTVTRLIYLNTFTHFGDNKLMLTERTPMKRKDLANILGVSKAVITKFWREVSPKYYKKFKLGGLADFTGLAQLDGTPSKPELVLNADDTKNFLELRDALRMIASQPLTIGESYKASSIPHNITGIADINSMISKLSAAPTVSQNNNVTFGDIRIDHVDDYNDFVTQLQRDPKFEQMIQAMTTDILGGGSSLAKYKYHWK